MKREDKKECEDEERKCERGANVPNVRNVLNVLNVLNVRNVRNVPKPQLLFKDEIDNSEVPFVPKLNNREPKKIRCLIYSASAHNIREGKKSGADEFEFGHPFEREIDDWDPWSVIDVLQSKSRGDGMLRKREIILVSKECELERVVEELSGEKVICVDIENHSIRSFQGFVCGMEISTSTHNYLIDCIQLRHKIHILSHIFIDPSISKVMHNSAAAILQLQRDFGIYLIALFDIQFLAKARDSGGNISHILDIIGDIGDTGIAEYDWRIRPIGECMIQYAVSKTTRLFTAFHTLREELTSLCLHQVFTLSKKICLLKYEKPKLSDSLAAIPHNFPLYPSLSNPQRKLIQNLVGWRDRTARFEDESPVYLLPDTQLLAIAQKLPSSIECLECLGTGLPVLSKKYQLEILNLVRYSINSMKREGTQENMENKHPDPMQANTQPATTNPVISNAAPLPLPLLPHLTQDNGFEMRRVLSPIQLNSSSSKFTGVLDAEYARKTPIKENLKYFKSPLDIGRFKSPVLSTNTSRMQQEGAFIKMTQMTQMTPTPTYICRNNEEEGNSGGKEFSPLMNQCQLYHTLQWSVRKQECQSHEIITPDKKYQAILKRKILTPSMFSDSSSDTGSEQKCNKSIFKESEPEHGEEKTMLQILNLTRRISIAENTGAGRDLRSPTYKDRMKEELEQIREQNECDDDDQSEEEEGKLGRGVSGVTGVPGVPGEIEVSQIPQNLVEIFQISHKNRKKNKQKKKQKKDGSNTDTTNLLKIVRSLSDHRFPQSPGVFTHTHTNTYTPIISYHHSSPRN